METDTARAGRRARTESADQVADTPVVAPAGDETAEQQPQVEQTEQQPDGDETPAQTDQVEAVEEQDPIGAAVDAWFAGFNDSNLSRHPEFWHLVHGRLPELKAAIGAVPTA